MVSITPFIVVLLIKQFFLFAIIYFVIQRLQSQRTCGRYVYGNTHGVPVFPACFRISCAVRKTRSAEYTGCMKKLIALCASILLAIIIVGGCTPKLQSNKNLPKKFVRGELEVVSKQVVIGPYPEHREPRSTRAIGKKQPRRQEVHKEVQKTRCRLRHEFRKYPGPRGQTRSTGDR